MWIWICSNHMQFVEFSKLHDFFDRCKTKIVVIFVQWCKMQDFNPKIWSGREYFFMRRLPWLQRRTLQNNHMHSWKTGSNQHILSIIVSLNHLTFWNCLSFSDEPGIHLRNNLASQKFACVCIVNNPTWDDVRVRADWSSSVNCDLSMIGQGLKLNSCMWTSQLSFLPLMKMEKNFNELIVFEVKLIIRNTLTQWCKTLPRCWSWKTMLWI